MKSETSNPAKGVLFRPQLIRALLNTKPDVWPAKPINNDLPWKWQTRRLMAPQPTDDTHGSGHWYWKDQSFDSHRWPDVEIAAPYPVGTILYAKETWASHKSCDSIKPSKLADDATIFFKTELNYDIVTMTGVGRWRTSLYIPRKFARLWFKVMNVRVERVNKITEADAKAEGMEASKLVELKDGSPCFTIPFQDTWDGINGNGDFNKGSWVFVYDIARINKP